MRWDVLDAPLEKIALAQELVRICSVENWGNEALRAASRTVLQNPERWRLIFPNGSRDAIWFISEMSDAAMELSFEKVAARSMRQVILERLSQNAELKPFVRRVMIFDVLHPFQALARMQRTSRVMFDCVMPPAGIRKTNHVTLLNLAYTAIVFAWLFDREGEGALTKNLTARLMSALKL